MTNFLQIDPENRPDLPIRTSAAGKVEVLCGCGQWRPGFTMEPVDPPREGKEWACDGCRGRWAREAAAVPTLASARAVQRAIIEAAKTAVINGGIVTTFGLVNSDPESRSFINGAVSVAREAADAQQPFFIEFTMADDTDKPLDGAEMRQLGVEVGVQVGIIHARARVLKARIEAAETLAEVAAVTWTLEDPE